MADTKALTVSNIVVYDNGKIYTTSRIVSEITGIKHKYVKWQISRHKEKFLKWGRISATVLDKSRRKKVGRPEEEIPLNREQTMFLLLLLENKANVVKLKEAFISEFLRLEHENTLLKKRHYKEIGESIRAKIEAFGEVVGRTAILCLTERDQMLLI